MLRYKEPDPGRSKYLAVPAFDPTLELALISLQHTGDTILGCALTDPA
jgi:hypothetical protein